MKSFFESIRLKKLVGFDCLLEHDFSTNECKNLKRTYAVLVFKISESDGSLKVKTLEVSLNELKQFKDEIIRIEETLSWLILTIIKSLIHNFRDIPLWECIFYLSMSLIPFFTISLNAFFFPTFLVIFYCFSSPATYLVGSWTLEAI